MANPGILMPDLGIGILSAILRRKKIEVGCTDLKPLFTSDTELMKLRLMPLEKAEEGLFESARTITRNRSLRKAKILGFSLDEETDLPLNLKLIKSFKELTGASIIAGGSFKFSPAMLEANPFIDFIIRGDATISLPLLLRGEDHKKIPGLIFRQRGTVTANPYLRQTGNVDILPDFSDFCMNDYRLGLARCKTQIPDGPLKKQIEIPGLKITILPYHFIKGCPNQCSYCFWHREKFLEMTRPEKVADNLQILKEKYKADHFVFLNNEFNPTLRYAESVLSEIISRKLGITWSDSVHPATVNKDLLPLFKESGCAQLFWGLESLSPRLLGVMNRRGDPTQYAGLLKTSHELGIFNGTNFMVGIPFEREGDIRLTERFAKKNSSYYEFYNINLLRIYPEFVSIKDARKLNIKIRDFGSMELRNPKADLEAARLLESAGISKKLSFYSYDEINGLTWEKKNAQDIRHVKILNDIHDYAKKTFFDDTRLICYLLRSLNTKNEILKWYKKIKNTLGRWPDRP